MQITITIYVQNLKELESVLERIAEKNHLYMADIHIEVGKITL